MERVERVPSEIEPFSHARFLTRLARRLVEDEHAAADVVQEAWIRALERPPRSGGSLRGWLATTVRRLASNTRRGDVRRREREQGSAREEAIEPHDLALARLESQREVFDLVLALPETSRTVLFLRYYEDLGPDAIAARLGIAVKTVKNRHTSALAELRERLDRRHGGRREAWVLVLAPLARRGVAPSSSVPVLLAPGIAGPLGGLLAMKKMLVAVMVVVGILFVWREARPHEPSAADEPLASTAASPPTTPVQGAAEPEVAAPHGSADRRAVGSTSTPPSLGSLRVGLRWSDGTPAVDVGIDARPEGKSFPRMELWRAWTDAAGFTRFEDLPLGKVELSIDRDFHFEGIEVTAVEREVVLDLPEGDRIEGRVVGPGGLSVAVAEIWTYDRWGWPSVRSIGHTANDGSFTLRSVGEECLIGARAVGFQPSVFVEPKDLPVGPSGARAVTLELGSSGVRIEGRVLDPDGAPLGGALVMAGQRGGYVVDLSSGGRGTAGTNVCVASSANGSFVFPGDFAPGRVPIFAVARGLPISSTAVEASEGAVASVEIRLTRPATVVGRVLGSDGSPVEGAWIRFGEEDRGGWFHDAFPTSFATSGADGAFRLECVASGSQYLHAEASSARLGRANARVACREGEETRAELVLELGDVIRGRVVDARGVPMGGWIVKDVPQPYGQTYPRQDTTDADGTFLLANLGPGSHELSVRNPDDWMECARVPARAGEEKEIVVDDVVATAFVEGTVVGTDGGIPADVAVVMRREGEGEALIIEYDPTSGRFHGGPFIPGRYRIEVLRGWKAVAESEFLDVPENGRVDFGTLHIGEPGAVELEVRGFAPEVAWKLRPCLDRSNHATETFTLQEGRLLCERLVPGEWTASIGEREIYVRPTPVEVRPGETIRLELVPEPTSLVTVLYLLSGDAPRHAIDLEVHDETGAKVWASTVRPKEGEPTSGLGSRLHLPRGRMAFVARTDDGRSGSATLDIDPGTRPTETLELRLE